MGLAFQLHRWMVLALLLVAACSGCSKGTANQERTPAVPVNEVDGMLNEYEKVSTEYVRVAKELKKGDVSITVRYIDLGQRTREGSTRLQQRSASMSPEQAQRLAAISAKTAPYLQP